MAVPRWLGRTWLGRTFAGIDDDLETSIGTFDFHKIARYLRSPQMVKAVRPYLAG